MKINSPTTTMALIVVVTCALRFLLDGITLTLFGHSLSIGHTDPLAYGAILTPILAAHGYVRVRINRRTQNNRVKVGLSQ